MCFGRKPSRNLPGKPEMEIIHHAKPSPSSSPSITRTTASSPTMEKDTPRRTRDSSTASSARSSRWKRKMFLNAGLDSDGRIRPEYTPIRSATWGEPDEWR
ncbi:hypothetical protein MMC09_001618 [Bachmanniomyces sp. S44760]|nr:hypothetical protein [Bachmanniomyces sp. S44760]